MEPSPIYPRMHVSLYVSHLPQTIAFYRQFFGQEPDKVKPHYAKFILSHPSLIISFVENPERVHSHFGHLGFQVESHAIMEEQLERARALDIVHEEEMGTACCYALQDKFWVEDPDGHRWEVYYLHGDSEFNDPRYDVQAPGMPLPALSPSGLAEPREVGECQPGSGCC